MRNFLTSTSLSFALALALAVPALAQDPAASTTAVTGDANAALKSLVDEYWADVLKSQPIFASSLGIDTYANEVGDSTLEGMDRNAANASEFLTKLRRIAPADLTPANKVEYGILDRTLKDIVDANSFGQRTINFSTYSSWHQNMASMANNLPFRNAADYKSYIARIKQFPRINDENIAVASAAVKGGFTLPCVSLNGFEKTITGLMTADPKASRFYEPFTRTRPETIDAAEFEALSAEAANVIDGSIKPALQKELDWYTASYKPKCAKQPGMSAQPNGAAYYDYRIRNQTTTTLTAEQIHQIGLGEVARIRAEMVEVAKTAGYSSREAYIQHLRTDLQYFAKTPEELMEKVARITKTIDGKMPSLFRRLPRLPYGIKEIPAEIAEGTTTAYYNPGSPDVGIAGNYYVNTSKLDQRPFWEIPALSVHEAVPGHHQQIALQQELPLSDFRKNGAFFTAFVEGWGLYSERLGIEMGLYDTPAKNMGRLSYEMWRACRLVVDTGIHAKGWPKEQATAFMKDNTALTDANIEAEVNRYISWPGQALAYKLGELKIRELRGYASKELGAKFDLAAFHDVVLGQGAVPLDVLDAQVKDWVAGVK
jgi:uncharacterized protein (DUF885 family)